MTLTLQVVGVVHLALVLHQVDVVGQILGVVQIFVLIIHDMNC